jgi:hypothetical protein
VILGPATQIHQIQRVVHPDQPSNLPVTGMELSGFLLAFAMFASLGSWLVRRSQT